VSEKTKVLSRNSNLGFILSADFIDAQLIAMFYVKK